MGRWDNEFHFKIAVVALGAFTTILAIWLIFSHPSVSLRQLFQLHPLRGQTTSQGFLRSSTYERSNKDTRLNAGCCRFFTFDPAIRVAAAIAALAML
jgi:hypothetical protein